MLVDGDDDGANEYYGLMLGELKMALSFVNEWQGSPLLSGQDTPKQWQTNRPLSIPSSGPEWNVDARHTRCKN